MGTDINGWVEVQRRNSWEGVIKVGNLAGRNYDLFSCPFGIVPYARFTPICQRAWIADGYFRGRQRELSDLGRGLWSDLDGMERDLRDRWGRNGWDTRRGSTITRKATLDHAPDCKLLLQLTEILATEYGGENVRLVVWFDH